MKVLVDLIVTGDRDFLALELERPRCLTASDYLKAEQCDNN